MIPKRLTIKGFYSYQESQTIDFEKLCKAGIFGIFGEVGSGKSSIVEAILFSLYGQVHRLGGRNKNNNLMNLSSNELFIDFIFEASGKEYQIITNGKRNKRTNNIEKITRNAYIIEDDKKIPIDVQQIPEIIGIDYKNFTKTIIIPQDNFKAFLEQTSADRSTMLEQLFGLSEFDLFEKTRKLEQNIEWEISNLKGKIEGLKIQEDQSPEILSEEIKTLECQIHQNTTKLNEITVKLSEIDEFLQKINNLKKLENDFSLFKSRQTEINKLQEITELRELCDKIFASDLNKINELNLKKTELEKKCNDNNLLVNEIKNKIVILSEKINKYTLLYNKKEELTKEAEAINKIAEIIICEQELTTLLNNKTRFEKELENYDKKIIQIKNEILEKEKELKKNKEEIKKYENIEDLGIWYAKYENITQSCEKLQKTIQEYENEINTKSENIEKICNEISTKYNKKIDKKNFYCTIEEIINERNQDIKKLEEEISHKKFISKMSEFANLLKDGQPCPLCGSTVHPKKFSNLTNQTELINLENFYNNLRKDIETLNKLKTQIESNLSQIEMINKEKNKNIKSLNNEEIKKESLFSQFKWEGFHPDGKDQFIQAQIERNNLKRIIEELESDIKLLSENLEYTISEKDKATIIIEKTKNDVIEVTTKINVLKQTIHNDTLSKYKIYSPKELNDKSKKIIDEIKNIVKEYEHLRNEELTLSKQLSMFEGQLEELSKQKSEIISNIKSLEEEINLKLKENNFESIEKVKNILKEKIDVNENKKIILDYNLELNRYIKDIDNLKKEIEGKIYDESIHKEIESEKNLLTKQIEKDKATLAIKKEKLKEIKEKIELLKNCNEELIKKEMKLENIKLLKSLFTAKGFIMYVSRLYLKQLIQLANMRFLKMTKNELCMELNEDNEIEIIDYHNGGKRRSIKTLSGGQMFQASLALALSLTYFIGINLRNDKSFFFIDEGFGSQDKNSLSLIMDTLYSLRKEQRIIGLISHVEEMQKKLDVYITTLKTNDKGTIIKNSWS